MKSSRKPLFVCVITVCLLMSVTVAGLMAEEKTSGTSDRPSIIDPKEMGGKVELITAEELKKLIDARADIVVVDTQGEGIYDMKHIKGAINFTWAPVIGEPVNLPRGKLLILYCGCVGEEGSKDVARQLISNWGFKQIKVLVGGLSRWLKLGYPTEP
jgi:3-mercaptopyruvate sulfurtransferase SseA